MTVIKELKKESRSEEAKELLERLMKHCAPAIKRHKWKLVELKEFYPKNNGLLGVNVNKATICIRLRCPFNKDNFREWHELLGVMVHELTHMDISKHSAEFYTKMDELYTEIENDESSGLINRFDGTNVNAGIPSGPGRALGGKDIGAKPKSREEIAHDRAAAAERRRRVQTIMGGGVVGKTTIRQKKPLFDLTTQAGRREAMAWAATKRASDNEACSAESQLEMEDEDEAASGGCGSSGGGSSGTMAPPAQPTSSSFSSSSSSSSAMLPAKKVKPAPGAVATKKKAKAKASPMGVIDLTMSPSASQEESANTPPFPPAPLSAKAKVRRDKAVAVADEDAMAESQGEAWACPICTYFNIIDTDLCGMCSYRFRAMAPVPLPEPISLAHTVEKRKDEFNPFKPFISSGNSAWKGSKRPRE